MESEIREELAVLNQLLVRLQDAAPSNREDITGHVTREMLFDAFELAKRSPRPQILMWQNFADGSLEFAAGEY